jgi:hypothetical protein
MCVFALECAGLDGVLLLRLEAARVLRKRWPLTAIRLPRGASFEPWRHQAAAGQSGVEPPHSNEHFALAAGGTPAVPVRRFSESLSFNRLNCEAL